MSTVVGRGVEVGRGLGPLRRLHGRLAHGGALAEGPLGPGPSVRGLLAFVVPRTAAGLVLQYDSEVGDGSARVPLT